MTIPLPDKVRVGYRDYRVAAMSPMESTGKDRFGECDNCAGAIGVREDLAADKQVNTMVHELLHACWYVADLPRGKQERIVTALANQLTQVWRDNPALVAWIGARILAANSDEVKP